MSNGGGHIGPQGFAESLYFIPSGSTPSSIVQASINTLDINTGYNGIGLFVIDSIGGIIMNLNFSSVSGALHSNDVVNIYLPDAIPWYI